ncbi:MAG: hypothetical protein SGJ20_06870 [Planctomycetota bacterium]|nr:hypothetical protein [Planctomycetota bacterium]
MAQFQLTEQHFHDLQVIRDLDADVLRNAAESLSELSPPPLKPSELFAAVKASLAGDDDRAAHSIMRQCLSFNGLMRQVGVTLDAVISGIGAAVERESRWNGDEIAKWKTLEPHFRALVMVEAFRIVSTSIELSYDYANLYQRGKILTDIRPLFTEDADAVRGAVISFTLRLRYDSVDGDHGLSIAMDEDDIRDLASQCERALKKARTARELMHNRANIPTILTGERSDD